jgi:hypothetical protein
MACNRIGCSAHPLSFRLGLLGWNLTCQQLFVKGATNARGVCPRQTESLTNRR